ncbi:MAG TPA: metallophosphoesterase [Gemmatimonadales bacterium]|nr:metallophosphoesterase [Gemmatimonadales bacterium]
MRRQSYFVALAAALPGWGCIDRTGPGGEPLPPNAASAATSVVVVAAGDIATCNSSGDEATARLLDKISGTVLALGDLAYPDGTASNFSKCYRPSWGRHRSRTRPTPGNHEYHSSGAAPYYSYFGSRAGPARRGYYSYNLGSWHIVVLESEANRTAQVSWLKADLAANRRRCTLAYWHRPLFTSSSKHGPFTAMRPLFTILYNAGADLVLSAHNHQYERFYPQTPTGAPSSSRGIRQFVVGTGGAGLYGFRSTPARNSQKRYKGGYGVLKLTLNDASYSWRFISVAGKTFSDAGSASCH